MNIISTNDVTLDDFIKNIKKLTVENIEKALESYDKSLYLNIDHERFKIIRLDERTLLTSVGIVHFRRRYYYDTFMEDYFHLLDTKLEIPKSSRITNELRIRIFRLAAYNSYSLTGKFINDDFSLSKSTICRIIKTTKIEEIMKPKTINPNLVIHLQIDEKYVGFTKEKNKKRLYTATIFAGIIGVEKNKHKLLNRTLLSDYSLTGLTNKINYNLKENYKVKPKQTIFISGDLATYIQNFKDSITVCRAIYVPDKFHVFKALKDYLGLASIKEDDITPKFINCIAKQMKDDDVEIRKIVRLFSKKNSIIKNWKSIDYLGCSQEGMNSHYYAPRFGKYANRFNKETIRKLSLVIESEANNNDIKVTNKEVVYEDLNRNLEPINRISEIERNVLDTREMQYWTAIMFNKIKYGG